MTMWWKQIRVADPFAQFAKGWGIALCTIAFVLAAHSQHAQNSCGLTQLPSSGEYYPATARATHMSGQVVLLASFDHQGKASVTRVVSGPPMLIPAAKSFVEASGSEPSAGSRECAVVIEFEAIAPEWGNDCELLNAAEHSLKLVDPQHVFLSQVAGACCCDPAAEITKARRRFLIFHRYSKSA
jgi:hypothetical protein